MPRRRAAESGAGAINLLVTVVLLIAVGLGLSQLLPAQSRRSKMMDYMVEQTQTAIRTPAKTIEKRLYDKAIQWKVPLDRENIHVAKSNARIRITVSYVEPLNFVVYTHQWKINLDVDRPIFQF